VIRGRKKVEPQNRAFLLKTKNMKILYLLSQRSDSTGSGFYVQALIKEASDLGHSCFLVSAVSVNSESDTEDLPPLNCSFIRFEGETLPFPIPGMSDVMPYKSRRFIDMTGKEIDDYKQSFKKIISDAADAFKPDIIHTNHLWIMSAVVRELFPDMPMVTSCHGTDLRQLKNCEHLKNKVIESCKKINRVIALSEIQKKEITEMYGIPEKRIIVAGNGFNDKLFIPAKKTDVPPVKLLYAGKLSASKGVPWLLQSLSLLKNLKIPFHLYLAGGATGSDYEICRKLAEKIKDRVTLCGVVKQDQLAKLMGQSHIFILPSFFEGLPLVLFEALASGCKIITTSLPGSKEIAGSAGSDLIRFIDLPKLETVDSPFESDMPVLIEKLAGILKEEIEKAVVKPNFEMAEVEKIIGKYTWKEVFKRIDAAYKSI